MPNLIVDYDNTHFYKLVCIDSDIRDCYIGYTTDFNRRKREHKSMCIQPESICYNTMMYQFIRDNGGWDNFNMIIIETRTCENALEAEMIECQYIKYFKPALNISMYKYSPTFKIKLTLDPDSDPDSNSDSNSD
jgi:hypothetical protein